MSNFQNTNANNLFLKSALIKEGKYKSSSEIINWLGEHNKNVDIFLNLW